MLTMNRDDDAHGALPTAASEQVPMEEIYDHPNDAREDDDHTYEDMTVRRDQRQGEHFSR